MELPHTDKTIVALKDAVQHHYSKLAPLRKKRANLLSVAAGADYQHSNHEDREFADILNLMRQASEAMTLSMAANRPRFLVTPDAVQNMAFADHFARALNVYSEKIKLERVLQECVRNAFYFLGIAKVGFGNSTADLVDSEEYITPGSPFCVSVSPSHLSYDTTATDWSNCSFIADRYRVRYDDLINDGRFDGRVRTEIKEAGPQSIQTGMATEWGTNNGEERASEGEFEEFVFLCDVFLPRDGVIYTFPCDEGFQFTTDRPFYVDEWDGRDEGPYHFLNLGPLPDKTTPSSPAQNLVRLHHLCNSLYRNLSNQAERQKNLLVGRKGGEDDAEAIRIAEDGDMVLLNEPDAVRAMSVDGPNQQNFGFMLNALERFSEQGGNLRHKLGLTQSADTASQESMIGANVSRVEGAYQQRFVEFVRGIAEEVGRLLFADEGTDIPMTQEIPGAGVSIDDPWLGARKDNARQGQFDDYGLNIDPYSLPYRSPEDRLAQLDQTLDRTIPLLPLLMQQGVVFDAQEYLRQRAKLIDLPEIESIFKFQQPPPPEEEQGGGGNHERTLQPNTQRQYEHISRSAGGGGNENAAALQMMAAQNGAQQ